MGISWKIVKNAGPAAPGFKTPEQGWPRNVQRVGENTPGTIGTDRIYFRLPGKTAAEEYGYATATAGEFDIPIPGSGSIDDWLNQSPPGVPLGLAGSDCSPTTQTLGNAYQGRSHFPDRIINIAQTVAQCEQRIQAYDWAPTEYEFGEIAGDLSAAPELKKYLPFRIGQLKQIAEDNGIQIPWLIAWAGGIWSLARARFPNLSGIELAKAVADTTPAQNDKLADLLGKEVIALNKVSQIASGILWVIGRIHGDFWNDYLDAALVRHDLQVDQQVAAGTYAPKKTAIPITTFKTTGGKTGYRISGAPSPAIVRKRTEPDKPPVYASGIHQRVVEKTKDQHRRQAEAFKVEAREHHASMVRADEHHLTNAVKAAIEWFVPCDSPGELYRKEISKAAIEVVCGDVGSFDELNTPEIAAMLHAELAEQTGTAPPPPTEEKGSPLPWILAAAGLMFGGPLGAGAGFAIGKSMGNGDANKTL